MFQDTVPARAAGQSIHAAVTLSSGAQFGTWTVSLQTDPQAPAIASETFQVDAFVPPRLAAEFAGAPAILEPGRSTDLPVSVRFLYGAPGSDLSGTGTVTLSLNPTPFADFATYRFGLADEVFAPKQTSVDLAATDDEGKTVLPVDLSAVPDTSGAIQADVQVAVNDPAGRSVGASATIPVRPVMPLIGIAEDFGNDTVDASAKAGFHIIAVAPDGKRTAMPVQIRLVRQEPDWRLTVSNGQARYETVWRDEPVDSQDVTLAAGGAPFGYGRPLPFGRYRLQVLQASGGLAASSVVFYSGWAVGDNPDVPARVSVRVDHKDYEPGDTATVHVEAPFAGPATVMVMTDRVKRILDLPNAGSSFDVQVPVTADWGPGAYIGVHVFRPGGTDGKTAPARAIGLTWVALNPASRSLPVTIDTAPIYRPRTTADIAVHATPGAWVTLASVDEGILSLTGFQTPDPLGHYFGQRSLGVGIHDDWARLLAPAGAANTMLRQGAGGDVDEQSNPIPQMIVSLFSGPVQAGSDGVAHFPLALPDFDGQLRLMAVAWDGDKVGSAAHDVTLRDPLIAEPLLPRFLAPGDTAQIGILLQNLELPAGQVSVHVSATGAVALAGGDPAPVTLAQQARTVLPVQLVAQGAGLGTLTFEAKGPGGFDVTHSVVMSVHSARGPVSQVTPLTLAAGADQTVGPDASAFLPGTWKANFSFGGGVRYDPAALVRALAAYPLDCLEQLTSRGLPLAMLTQGGAAGPDRAGKLQQATEAVLDRQRYDGSFGLWSSTDDAQPWLTAYATDFLLRARKAGAAVPDTAIAQAIGWLTTEVASPPGNATDQAAQAYALYVLSLTGQAPAGAIRLAVASIDDEPTPLARAQIAASLARLGEAEQARDLFTSVLGDPSRQDWYGDYGSALRDQFATAVLVQESGVMAGGLPAIRAALPGADLDPDTLNTQEQAWGGAAAAALGANARPISLVADGRTLGPAPVLSIPVHGMVTLRNPGTTPLAGSLVVQGVPVNAPPAKRQGMEVHRQFYGTDGSTVDPDKLPQNSVFVMVITGRATDHQDHQAMVLAGLPAGWEIAGRFPSGTVDGMDWLGTLSDTDAQAAADDRYAAALSLTSDQPDFRLAVMLRAVTPGTYDYPGITLADMYRPGIFARQNACADHRAAASITVKRLARAAAGCAALLVAASAVGFVWPAPMPAKGDWGTEIRDRNGALLALAPAPGGVWRFAASPAQVSPFLTQLLIAVEDRRFAVEPGVDLRAILRAGWQWLRAGHVVSGGSTLTMQVARLLDPEPRGLPAKALETVRALALWSRCDRPRILGLWLSLAPFGGNLVGVEAASWAYFGKPPGALDAAEAALLVALPRRPEALRPDRHPAAAKRIRDRILALAEARGLLTPEEMASALAEPVPTARLPMPRAAPQFYASIHHPPVLTTTLDAETQAALMALARARLAGLPPRVSLAVMIADLPSGTLRAVWAGDWGNPARAGSVDLTRVFRSPGSALKPFLYGLAFSQGLAGPDTILADVPTRFGGYAPEDFSGQFAGRVTAAEALRRSLNLPAVELLARYGAARFAAALAASGQPLLLPPGAAPSLPIVLGGAGQTMRGMMALYTALATDGAVGGRRLLTPAAAQMVAAVLTRTLPGGEQQGIAWKTGTSWGDRDNWAFGFDRDHVVGVWVGRPDGTAMDGGAAADHALPILAQVFGLLPPAPRDVPPPATRMLSLAIVPDADPLRLLFPPPGAVIEGEGEIDLKVMGGTRPLHFLVDGAPVSSVAALRDTMWTPPGPGFYRVTILDGAGNVISAAIRVRF